MEKTFTKAEFAKLANTSTRTIERAVEDKNVIPLQMRPMKFSFETVVAYLKAKFDEAKGKEKDQIAKSAELEKLNGEARIKQAKAEIEELKLKELRGELHRAEDIEALVTDHALYIRSILLAMPGKLAVDIAGLGTAAEISARIRKEVYYILECASEYKYDPEEYARRVREREGWKEVAEDEED